MGELPATGKRLHAKLSVDAYNGLVALARREGVSVTALIEAMGLVLHEHGSDPARIRGRADEWLTLARRVDSERRSRGAD